MCGAAARRYRVAALPPITYLVAVVAAARPWRRSRSARWQVAVVPVMHLAWSAGFASRSGRGLTSWLAGRVRRSVAVRDG